MTKEERYSNIPETLLPKIAALLKEDAKKAKGVCQRHNVPTDVTEAFLADVEDLLHGHYYPMHATTEQMRLLCKNVSSKSWDKTGSAPLGLIALYYNDIIDMLDVGRIKLYASSPTAVNLWAVSQREVLQRAYSKDGQPLEADGFEINGEIYDLTDGAQRLYYALCVQIVGERTDATEDELRAIDALVPVAPEDVERAITMALNMRQQRLQAEARLKQQKAAKKGKPTYGDKPLYGAPLNIVLMEARGLQTSNLPTPHNPQPQWQPLRLQLENKSEQATAIMSNPNTTDLQKKQAAQFVATGNDVMQALEAMQVIAQEVAPTSGDTNYIVYEMPVREFTKYCTQTEKPNNKQVEASLRGALFLSSQRLQVEQQLLTNKKEKDANGKTITKEVTKTIVTNFQPLVVKLQSEYEDDVLIEQATRITLRIDKMLIEGRREQHIKDGKTNYFVLPQKKIYTTSEQMAAFSKTAQEITFLRLIQSATHCKEDDILNRVFSYEARQKDYDKKLQGARQALEVLKAGKDSKAEDIQQAEENVTATEQQARYYITNHMGRDVEQLTALFERAVAVDILSRWERKQTGNRTNKYGKGYVWEWKKALTPEEKEERLKKQKADKKRLWQAMQASKQHIKTLNA